MPAGITEEHGVTRRGFIASGALVEGYGVMLHSTQGQVIKPGATDGTAVCAGVVEEGAADGALVKIKNHEPGGCVLARCYAAITTIGQPVVMEASDGRFKPAAFSTAHGTDDVLLYAHGFAESITATQDEFFQLRLANIAIPAQSL